MEATEQLINDNKYLNDLETNIIAWRDELKMIEKELIDQALIDTKAGARSNRYIALETREKTLKGYLREAESRITSVSERYEKGPLSGLINTALNRLRV
jgi:predicted  nucleic acid-binding Zn-ribbon protein